MSALRQTVTREALVSVPLDSLLIAKVCNAFPYCVTYEASIPGGIATICCGAVMFVVCGVDRGKSWI